MSLQSQSLMFDEDRIVLGRPRDRLSPALLGALLGTATAAFLWATIVIHFGLVNCFWL